MILVFGTICVDRVRRVPFLPKPGGYVEAAEEISLLGGEAANTANVLVRWAEDVTLFGNNLERAGNGAMVRQLLAEKKIPLHPLVTGDETPLTPVCDIYVTPDGDRTMFGVGFSAMEEGLDLRKVPYREGEWFTAEPNMKRATDAARLAKEAGMHLYLMDFLDDDLPLGEGDLWQCSTDWAGTRGDEKANVEWVEKWVARYGCFAILTDGPRGLVAGSPKHPVRAYPAYPALAVVDTTGAGDVFRAGVLLGLQRNWPLPECLQFASAAGALKCQFLGATTQTPTVAQVQNHIREHDAVSRQFF